MNHRKAHRNLFASAIHLIASIGFISLIFFQSSKWVEKRLFMHFLLPPASEGIDLQEWKDLIAYYNTDLRWLLNLPHHKYVKIISSVLGNI